MSIEEILNTNIPINEERRIEYIHSIIEFVEDNEDEIDNNDISYYTGKLSQLSLKLWDYFLKYRSTLEIEERRQYWCAILKVDYQYQLCIELNTKNSLLKKKNSDFPRLLAIGYALNKQDNKKFRDFTIREFWYTLMKLVSLINNSNLEQQLFEYIQCLYYFACHISCNVYENKKILNYDYFTDIYNNFKHSNKSSAKFS